MLGPLFLAVAATASADAPAPERLEIAGLPALTYRSDAGLGVGVLGATTQFRPGCVPFCWRVLALAQGVLRWDDAGLAVPTRNAVVFWDVPQWQRPHWRLLVAVANYDDASAGYRGLGTRRFLGDGQGTETYRWHRRVGGFKWRQRVRGTLGATTGYADRYIGMELAWNTVDAPVGSRLRADLQRASGAGVEAEILAQQLGAQGDHADGVLNGGWVWDQRDHEFTPSRGGVHEVSMRVGQAGDAGLWASILAETAHFKTLIPQRLVLAGRLILDHAVGALPVYRRAELGGLLPSLGVTGAEGVRGVPTYHELGKTKMVGNLEMRLRLVDHTLAKQALSWRAVLFSDVGRALSDLHDRRLGAYALDSPWHHLRWGTGAGLRLRWGQAFVLRLDAAVAPLEGSQTLTFGTDHIF